MVIIIGTGLAGYQVAREFRKLNSTTPLTLITEDEGKFYPKPQLSTALTSKKTSATLTTAEPTAMATQLNATILTQQKVTKIDPALKVVYSNDEQMAYDKLVLACGAQVLKAPLEGDALNDVLSINHLYHYAEFEKLILNKKNITILGAGLIGCEFANDLSNAGYEVNIIAPDKTLLERFIPAEIGKLLQDALEKNGVNFFLNTTAKTFNRSGTSYQLELTNGKKLATEFLLSAIGLRPHIELARTANLAINRGIVVNRHLETSEANIYALGDCAEVEGHVLPYITPILNCAKALAKSLNDEPTLVDYPAMPVTVKTPAHPLVICPPPQHIAGNWEIEVINQHSIRALFYDNTRKLQGFVLTHDAVKERLHLIKEIPPLF